MTLIRVVVLVALSLSLCVLDATHRPWDAVAALARLLNFPTAHVVARQRFRAPWEIKALMDGEMKKPTSVQRADPAAFAAMPARQHVRASLHSSACCVTG
jgi:hypothetical protein